MQGAWGAPMTTGFWSLAQKGLMAGSGNRGRAEAPHPRQQRRKVQCVSWAMAWPAHAGQHGVPPETPRQAPSAGEGKLAHHPSPRVCEGTTVPVTRSPSPAPFRVPRPRASAAGCPLGRGHGHTAQPGCPRPQRKASDGLTPGQRCGNPGRPSLPAPTSPGATRRPSRSTAVAAQPGEKGGPMPGPDGLGSRCPGWRGGGS